ncbi:hypothetical protein BHE74_00000831 [Ensete ventricosum]|nr:hypothetical protein BHE74_00000831 [Ensete ventricosum]
MASPSRPTRVSSSLLLGLGFLIALIAFALQFYIRKHLRPRLWTVEELTLYNGTEDALPILLGILGYSKILLYALTSYHLLVSLVRLICERIDSFLCCSSVFDVTKGKTHYGPGGGYHHFAGRFVHFMILLFLC